MRIFVIGDEDGVHKHRLGDVATLILPRPGNGMLVPGVQDRAKKQRSEEIGFQLADCPTSRYGCVIDSLQTRVHVDEMLL